MLQPLIACLSLVSIVLSAIFIVFLYKFKRSMPDFAQIFDELGGNISKVFEEGFRQPQVKRAMTVLGKQSGEVRATKALKNKVAEKALGQNVLLKKALDYLDITPIEGLELLNDPTIGPTIRGLMASFQSGVGGALGGGGQRQSQRNDGGRVPVMS